MPDKMRRYVQLIIHIGIKISSISAVARARARARAFRGDPWYSEFRHTLLQRGENETFPP